MQKMAASLSKKYSYVSMSKVILVVHGTCVAIIFEKSRLLSNIEALQINLPVILEGNVQRPHPFLHIFLQTACKRGNMC